MDGLAIMTGGGSGIGRECAIQMARAGSAISVWDVDSDAAAQTAEYIREVGGQAVSFAVDVASQSDIHSATKESIKKFGPVRTLVTSAGMSQLKDFLDMTLDDWNTMISVNLTGTFLSVQSVVPSMIDANYGRIVLIASLGAFTGSYSHSHYAASKAGVVGFGKAISKGLGPYGITVNIIAPGAIDTPMLAIFPDEIIGANVRNPMGRLGTPSDIARVAVFLASPESNFMTGTVTQVNGGSYV